MKWFNPFYREDLSNAELAKRLRNGYWTDRGYLLDIAEVLARLLATEPADTRKGTSASDHR